MLSVRESDLTEGNNTITATYDGVSTTFTLTITGEKGPQGEQGDQGIQGESIFVIYSNYYNAISYKSEEIEYSEAYSGETHMVYA